MRAGRDCKGTGQTFWAEKTVLYLDCSGGYMTAHICNSYGTVCLKRVNFTVYKHTLINLALKKEKEEEIRPSED